MFSGRRQHEGHTAWPLIFAVLLLASGCQIEKPKETVGGPIGWTVTGGIKRLPNGGRPITKAAFPVIKDWSTLDVVLERSGCFGSCPAYSVRIRGDGTVQYDGSAFVAITGHHASRIPESSVQELYQKFRGADFFWLFDKYEAPITDSPEYRIGIGFDGKQKRVTDYVGRAIGMPQAVTDLENAIDQTGGTAKWVKSTSETFSILAAEGHDFRSTSDENLMLLVGAARNENAELTRNLLRAGVQAKNGRGCEAVMAAVRNANLAIVKLLLDAGAPVHAEPVKERQEYGCDALLVAASRGVPEVLTAILAQHPDVNAAGNGGITPLMQLAENAYPREIRQNFAACARLLIAAGAQVGLRSDNGETPLMMANQDPALVRVLLALGATDIDAQDYLGHTALMSSTSPEVTKVLLQAGANPWLRDSDGRTAFDLAKIETWRDTAPVLEDWMKTHPPK